MWKAFDSRFGKTTEAVMEKVIEKKPLSFGKDRSTLTENRQPNREPVRQPFEGWYQATAIALPKKTDRFFKACFFLQMLSCHGR